MADDQQLSELTSEDRDRLDQQRAVVERYLADDESRRKYETPAGKLGTLRALLNAKAFGPDQTYELQCMGIVLGDVFVQDMGFRWIMVEDQYGLDPAIKYKETSIILYPLTMISKRVERGEQVDVFDLYNGIAAQVEDIIHNKLS
jgi:hypothetical protein